MANFQFSKKLRLALITRKKGMPDLIGHLWIMTEKFALISAFDEGLDLDGFMILLTRQQLKVKTNFKQFKFYSKILKNTVPENLINIVDTMKINSLSSIIDELYSKGSFVSVYLEYKYPDILWLGPIIKISKKHLWINRVSTTGEEVGNIQIRWKDISIIDFATRYISVYEKFSQIRHYERKVFTD